MNEEKSFDVIDKMINPERKWEKEMDARFGHKHDDVIPFMKTLLEAKDKGWEERIQLVLNKYYIQLDEQGYPTGDDTHNQIIDIIREDLRFY